MTVKGNSANDQICQVMKNKKEHSVADIFFDAVPLILVSCQRQVKGLQLCNSVTMFA